VEASISQSGGFEADENISMTTLYLYNLSQYGKNVSYCFNDNFVTSHCMVGAWMNSEKITTPKAIN